MNGFVFVAVRIGLRVEPNAYEKNDLWGVQKKIYTKVIYQNARCRCRRRRRRCYNILVLATVPDDIRERQDEWQWNTWSVAAARFRRGGEPGHARAVPRAFTCVCVREGACTCACVCCCVLRAHEFVQFRARTFYSACVCVCVWLCAAVRRAHFKRTCSVGRRRRHSDDAAVGSASAANGTCDTVTAANGLKRAGFIVAAKVIVQGTPFFFIFLRYSFLDIIFHNTEAGAFLAD